MEGYPYLLHALSPVHAGTGQGVEIIDLPIARMRSTGIPIIPGSSIKGVCRDEFRQRVEERKDFDRERYLAIFGPEPGDNDAGESYAGALMVSDARLLAMPVRSFRGTFVWATSPLLLQLAARDLAFQNLTPPQALSKRGARVAALEENINLETRGMKIYLEDLDIRVSEDRDLRAWSDFLAPLVTGSRDDQVQKMFKSRFVMLDDETMAFLWETATQIDTRIRLSPETRTVEKGALWTEESLPPETLMIGVMAAYDAKKPDKDKKKPTERLDKTQVLKDVLGGSARTLQFGGKASVGRGRCRLVAMRQNGGGR